MTQRYIRTYKLTLGIPLSFYEGEVSSTSTIATPPDRLARRAFVDSQISKRSLSDDGDRNRTNALLGAPKKTIGADGKAGSLLDPSRRAYEQFFLDQKELNERLNLANAEGVIVEGLNISFDLAIGEDETRNKITLYNISDKTRDLLIQRKSKFKPIIMLEAGYENDAALSLVFKGEVVHFNDVWEGATRVTTLSVQSAPTAIKEAYTIRSYKKGTNVEDIVRDVIKDMKLNYGVLYIPEENGSAVKVDKNYYIQCQSWEGLQNLCGTYELKASIENGNINVTPWNIPSKPDSVESFLAARTTNNTFLNTNAPSNTYYLNSSGAFLSNTPDVAPFKRKPKTQPTRESKPFDDGLVAPFTARSVGVDFERIQARLFDTASGNIIGSPILEDGDDTMERQTGKAQIIKIKVFLDATIKLQDVVKVRSSFVKGVYRVTSVRHYGEVEGREWYSELNLELLDSWVVDTGVDESNTRALQELRDKYENVKQ